MKKIVALCFFVALIGCKKSTTGDPAGTTTVQYDFTASASSNYLITYTDATGANVQVNYTGTSWSSPVLKVSPPTNLATGFRWAELTASGSSVAPISCNVDIKVGGIIKNTLPFTIGFPAGSTYLKVVVFN